MSADFWLGISLNHVLSITLNKAPDSIVPADTKFTPTTKFRPT